MLRVTCSMASEISPTEALVSSTEASTFSEEEASCWCCPARSPPSPQAGDIAAVVAPVQQEVAKGPVQFQVQGVDGLQEVDPVDGGRGLVDEQTDRVQVIFMEGGPAIPRSTAITPMASPLRPRDRESSWGRRAAAARRWGVEAILGEALAGVLHQQEALLGEAAVDGPLRSSRGSVIPCGSKSAPAAATRKRTVRRWSSTRSTFTRS